MGRSKFGELASRMEHADFVEGIENLYLYGTSGSGKSHILAALACKLIREGERVVYVPDCARLLDNFEWAIRTALCCAFYDSPLLETIESALDVDALLRFWKKQKKFYFIVDQLNALELGGRHASLDEDKKRVTKRLHEMRVHHKYIFSASANKKSNVDADMKQGGITVIRFLGGMNKVCFKYCPIYYITHII